MASWTTDQVLALAPDASSVKAGQGLANPGKWVRLEKNERSLWGECQGSGANPYRTQVDLTGPAFNCSCPSRKFPCKHGLGLMLILAGKPQHVKDAEPPPWVAEWISKREISTEKKAAKAQTEAAPADPETIAKREAEREKRAAKRDDRVRSGLGELQTWLSDVIRQGLAHAQQQPTQFWDGMAARMVDCQAPGIARVLRELPGVFASGDGWADRALEELGKLQLLLQGYQRLETLPEALRQDVRTSIGWTVGEEELAKITPVSERWQIVGQRIEEEDRLRVQRTWLIGEQTRRPALCLSFSVAGQPLDVSLVPGVAIDADLTFHPSAAPLRAVVKQRRGEPSSIIVPAAVANFAEALETTSTLIAGSPWLERFPWFVQGCVPILSEDQWLLRDANGSVIPLARQFAHPWPLLALSGGNAITVFGEWNGRTLLPLSAFADGHFISLGGASI
ncbi:MAG: SWIM zinc finger family protein [Verrucomicrobiaceae bacterium]|nr:MAG: SWIM zinc finger family protein [Verrucomicrobiaceae bacterium]